MTELRTMPSSLNDACRTIDMLIEAIEMAENRLDIALCGDTVCKHCVELARSYLTDVVGTPK